MGAKRAYPARLQVRRTGTCGRWGESHMRSLSPRLEVPKSSPNAPDATLCAQQCVFGRRLRSRHGIPVPHRPGDIVYAFRKETHVYLLLSPVATAVQDYRSTVGHRVLLVRLAPHSRKHTMAQCVSITYSTTRCMAAVFLSERFAPAMPGIGFQRGSPATIVRAFVDPPARDGTIHATGPPAHKG
jgi:hypothetical protein